MNEQARRPRGDRPAGAWGLGWWAEGQARVTKAERRSRGLVVVVAGSREAGDLGGEASVLSALADLPLRRFLADRSIDLAILGPEILGELTRTIQRRTLVVRLPSTEDDVLASAFARVPWELARPARGQPPLMDGNLAVRAITETTEAGDSAVHRVVEHLAATKGVVPGERAGMQTARTSEARRGCGCAR